MGPLEPSPSLLHPALDALSMFTATELLVYNNFVGLCVVIGAAGVGRVELKMGVLFIRDVNAKQEHIY